MFDLNKLTKKELLDLNELLSNVVYGDHAVAC